MDFMVRLEIDFRSCANGFVAVQDRHQRRLAGFLVRHDAIPHALNCSQDIFFQPKLARIDAAKIHLPRNVIMHIPKDLRE
jgi:hypothetical protein